MSKTWQSKKIASNILKWGKIIAEAREEGEADNADFSSLYSTLTTSLIKNSPKEQRTKAQINSAKHIG